MADITLFGFDPRKAPAAAARFARATWEAVVQLGERAPELQVAFVDLRDAKAAPAIRKLRETLQRELTGDDLPIVQVGDEVHAGLTTKAVESAKANAESCSTESVLKRRKSIDLGKATLHFVNSFPDATFGGMLRIHFPGLCGGMSATVLDYFYANQPAPLQRETPSTTTTEIGRYIRDRQAESVLSLDGARFVSMLANPIDDSIAAVTADEFALLKRKIDAGNPVPLGLLPFPWTPIATLAHQVVAKGYDVDDAGGLVVEIWDPNLPENESRLTQAKGEKVWVETTTGPEREAPQTWRGWFVEKNYSPKAPPKAPPGEEDTSGPTAGTGIAGGLNDFAFDLYRHLRGTAVGEDHSFVCSPFSVAGALLLVLAGAKGNTSEQIRRLFHVKHGTSAESLWRSMRTSVPDTDTGGKTALTPAAEALIKTIDERYPARYLGISDSIWDLDRPETAHAPLKIWITLDLRAKDPYMGGDGPRRMGPDLMILRDVVAKDPRVRYTKFVETIDVGQKGGTKNGRIGFQKYLVIGLKPEAAQNAMPWDLPLAVFRHGALDDDPGEGAFPDDTPASTYLSKEEADDFCRDLRKLVGGSTESGEPEAVEPSPALALDGPPLGLVDLPASVVTQQAVPTGLKVANRLFVADDVALDAAYQESAEDAFGAPAELVNFEGNPDEARARINRWVEQETHGRIRALIPGGGVTSETRLVIANAVWFLGAWQTPFQVSQTRPEAFRRPFGADVQVPMMHGREDLRYASVDGVEVLELPYKPVPGSGRVAMLVALPPETRLDALDPLEQRISAATLRRWVGSLRRCRVDVTLPLFRVETSASLREPLEDLGVTDLFDPRRVDLSGIADPASGERLVASDIFHKTFLRVDEHGTEAAAATAVVLKRAISLGEHPSELVSFRADRPFLFLLRDVRTGVVLFVGRMDNPAVDPAEVRLCLS